MLSNKRVLIIGGSSGIGFATARAAVKEGAAVEDALALTVRDISERRLQTQVFRKGLAKTPKQALQFIVHGHGFVGDKKFTAPSRIVNRDEEALIKVVGVKVGGKNK